MNPKAVLVEKYRKGTLVTHNLNPMQKPIKDLGISKSAPPAFHLLAKPTGAICNLDCAYCFFLDKETFYPGSQFRMSEDL